MSTVVTSFLPIDIKPKPYFVYSKSPILQHKLLAAAEAGFDIYENEYNKINNLPYALKENDHISIQEIFRDNWDDFVAHCKATNKPIRNSILTNVENIIITT